MKRRTRTEVWIDLSARAVAAALEAHEKRNPGTYITKKRLIPFAVERAKSLWEEDNTTLFDLEAIPCPSGKWMQVNWSKITLYAAQSLKKYIDWKEFDGNRLVTFEDWQKAPKEKLTPIARGIADYVEKRSRVTEEQGGTPYIISIEIPLLTDGNN